MLEICGELFCGQKNFGRDLYLGFMQKIMNPFPLSTGKLNVFGIHF